MGHIVNLRKQFESIQIYHYIITMINRNKALFSFGEWKVPYLTKLEYLSPTDALCHIWLTLAQWFWRRRFSNFVNVFSLFRCYFRHPRMFGWTWLNGSVLIFSKVRKRRLSSKRRRIVKIQSKWNSLRFVDVAWRRF